MTPALTFLAVLAVAAVACRVAHRRGVTIFHLNQFRPAAPLLGRLPDPDDRDATRALLDLRAARTHRECEQSSYTELDLSDAGPILDR